MIIATELLHPGISHWVWSLADRWGVIFERHRGLVHFIHQNRGDTARAILHGLSDITTKWVSGGDNFQRGKCPKSQIRSVLDAYLAENAVDIFFHRCFRKVKFISDLLV